MFPLYMCTIQVKYQDKDVIVREGAEANTFYIILKGEVKHRLISKLCVQYSEHIDALIHSPSLPRSLLLPSGPGDEERQWASEADSQDGKRGAFRGTGPHTVTMATQ